MEYLAGVLLALGLGVFATIAGYERDRVFYPVILIVVASYYVLFAVMGGSLGAVAFEASILCGFIAASVVSFKMSLWLIVVGLLGHGTFDLVRPHLLANSGAPIWWPMFCLAFDLVTAGYLSARLLSAARRPL